MLCYQMIVELVKHHRPLLERAANNRVLNVAACRKARTTSKGSNKRTRRFRHRARQRRGMIVAIQGLQFIQHGHSFHASEYRLQAGGLMAGPSASSAADRARRAGSLATPALDTRPHRPPDFAAESQSMHRLAQALTSSDGALLQTLSVMTLNLCEAGSAGIGLLESDADGTRVLRWVAISGECADSVNTTIPIADSPGGIALELAAGQLLPFPKRHFACLNHVIPEVIEELVVPIPGQ
ncbi:MAG TPA: hypothetical protein VG105_12525, partial [Paraburkholderia sp.]|nr:hypothetical protein [Paraburkholderia sp.]